jgi:hypothetical protein
MFTVRKNVLGLFARHTISTNRTNEPGVTSLPLLRGYGASQFCFWFSARSSS